MKTYNNLYKKIYSLENIYIAYLKARKNKRYKKQVLIFNHGLEENLLKIHKELKDGSYKHGGYKNFIVNDSKKRNINAPAFRDRVVHHALCNIIAPIFDKRFLFDSYACRKKKGTHRAAKRLQFFLKNKKNQYCLKCDVSKYFDSINHDVLIGLIEKKIKDRDTLSLIRIILKSLKKEFGVKGIPLGNLTSQLFANIVLNEVDNFAKHKLKTRYYIRYMDDFLLFSDSKQQLWGNLDEINVFLKRLKLKMNPRKVKIFPVSRGVEFVGYNIFSDHILLKKKSVKRMIIKIRKKYKNSTNQTKMSFWKAYSKIACSHGLELDFLNSKIFAKMLVCLI